MGKNKNEQCILQNFVIKVKKKISNFSINQLTLERYIHVHLGMQKRKKSENVHYINPASNAILIHVNGLGYL
jgi:hypothetical protein